MSMKLIMLSRWQRSEAWKRMHLVNNHHGLPDPPVWKVLESLKRMLKTLFGSDLTESSRVRGTMLMEIKYELIKFL